MIAKVPARVAPPSQCLQLAPPRQAEPRPPAWLAGGLPPCLPPSLAARSLLRLSKFTILRCWSSRQNSKFCECQGAGTDIDDDRQRGNSGGGSGRERRAGPREGGIAVGLSEVSVVWTCGNSC